MADPATRTNHELDVEPQDGEVRHPTVPIGRVLSWLRVAAGRRGHVRVTWWGAGFRYTLTAERRSRTSYALDHDRAVSHETGEVRTRLRGALD